MSENHVSFNLTGLAPSELKKTILNLVNFAELLNGFVKNPQVTKVIELVKVAANNDNFVALVADIITFFDKTPEVKDLFKDLLKDFNVG